MSKNLFRIILILAANSLLFGCSSNVIYDDEEHPGFGIPQSKPIPSQKGLKGTQKSYVVFGKRYYPMLDATGFTQKGLASWYGGKFHGRKTANGEVYDMYGMTAAHKELPLPVYVEVTNLENNRSIVVRVNDRGPFHEGRIIDLSYTAAKKLDVIRKGTAPVEIRVLSDKTAKPTKIRKPAQKSAAGSPAPKIYVQVGAFSSADNAESFRQQLEADLSRSVRLHETQSHTGRLYRVQVGPLASNDTAQRVAADLAELGIDNSHTIYD